MHNEKIKESNELFYKVIESLDIEQIKYLQKKLSIYIEQNDAR